MNTPAFRAPAASQELAAFLAVDPPQPQLPLIPRYQRRLGQWKVLVPAEGLPRDKDVGGLRVPLAYVLLLLNRAALIDRYPVALATVEMVTEIRSQLLTQGVNGTMPVVQATHHADSAAAGQVWVCWLDKTQFGQACRTMRADPAFILPAHARDQAAASGDHERIVLPSGEDMGGFYLFRDRGLAEAGPASPAPGCRPRLKIRRPAGHAAPAPASATTERMQALDYWPYKKLFPVWAEPPHEAAVEDSRTARRDGDAWQVAATTDDFSRAGQANVRTTQAEAAATGLKDGQLVVVRSALVPEQGTNIAALARLKLMDQAPDHTPAEYRYLQADQIVRDALGMDIGEIAVVTSCEVQRWLRLFDQLIGTPTYVMCRVQSADATTIEREVALVDELTLQLLGVESGDAVVIEGLPNLDRHQTRVPWVRIKALQISDGVLGRRSQLSGGDLTCRFPAARDSLGTFPDLPWIFLDSAARTALGLPGQKLGVVRIRASRRYQLVKEFRELLLVVSVAFIGILSIFSGITRYALVAALAFLIVAMVTLRMRSRLSRTLNKAAQRHPRQDDRSFTS